MPRVRFSIGPHTLVTGADAVAKSTGTGELPRTSEFFSNIIPTSMISAFAEIELLRTPFFAVCADRHWRT
ncbi:hypothetical protein EF294_02970 [Gordonia oryzae]|uniref:Uncharacterized protein n=1 Tax=Gordonia oryzae TaxID=2487349 RepID=A0A3N4GRX1_9ACTN|nr:hypothetical protein EF294_02970 [Gordonia oryzae]